MAEFFAELKRRQMFRVAAVYAVVAWLLLQVVNNLAPGLNLPSWVATSVIVLLALGFPVALIFAWIHQLAPADGATARGKAGRLDWVLIGALVAVILLIGYQQIAPSPTTRQAGVDAARSTSLDPGGAISLVVLPFTNLSSDPEQEFFSDGMTEEITSALAKIPDLRVVARTSAFQFKGENKDLRTVGQALGATHLIEGSVRKAGNRVRITAQLIVADSGVHVWTDSYDRELTDVFAIQEEIARAIAGALRMPLGLKPGARLVSNRLENQETHELYLRGRNLLRARGGVSEQALTVLEQVVARAPSFAPGWALLSETLRVRSIGDENRAAGLQRADDAARKAIELDPELAHGYAALAATRSAQTEWAESLDLSKKALALDPDHPEVLHDYRTSLRRLGYLKEALRISEHLTAVEPLVGIYTRITGEIEMANGLMAGAQTIAKSVGQATAANGGILGVRGASFLAAAQAQEGRLAEAADTLLKGVPAKDGQYDAYHAETAAQVLRAAAEKQKPPPLPAFNSELNFVYIHAGVPERMLEWLEQTAGTDSSEPLSRVWWPLPSSVRQTERFKALMRNAGLVDYWRAKGWPDLCRPVGADDFACE